MIRALAVLAVLSVAAGLVAGGTRALERRDDRIVARALLERMAAASLGPCEARHVAGRRIHSEWMEVVARIRTDGAERWRVDVERLVRRTPDGEQDLAPGHRPGSPERGPRGARRGPGGDWYRREYERRILIRDLDLALANYEVDVAGAPRFQGARTVRIRLESPAGDRPRREYRLEAGSGLVVEAREWGLLGQEEAWFRLLEHRPLSPGDATLVSIDPGPPGGSGRERGSWRGPFEHREVALEDLPAAADRTVYLPAALPRGFRFERARVVGGWSGTMVAIEYEDGLTRIGLVQRLRESREPDWDAIRDRMIASGLDPARAEQVVERMKERTSRGPRRHGGPPRDLQLNCVVREIGEVRVEAIGSIPRAQLVDLVASLVSHPVRKKEEEGTDHED